MSKNNSQDKDEKPSKKHKKASPSKKGKSKQEMNPTKPFEKISKYESEDECSDNDSDVSKEEAQDATSEPTNCLVPLIMRYTVPPKK